MNNLEKNRQIIDDIDRKIISLFKERMNAAKEIALYKKEHNLPVLNKEREVLLINKNIEVLNNEELKDYYLKFFNQLLEVSKDYQCNIINKESK